MVAKNLALGFFPHTYSWHFWCWKKATKTDFFFFILHAFFRVFLQIMYLVTCDFLFMEIFLLCFFQKNHVIHRYMWYNDSSLNQIISKKKKEKKLQQKTHKKLQHTFTLHISFIKQKKNNEGLINCKLRRQKNGTKNVVFLSAICDNNLRTRFNWLWDSTFLYFVCNTFRHYNWCTHL